MDLEFSGLDGFDAEGDSDREAVRKPRLVPLDDPPAPTRAPLLWDHVGSDAVVAQNGGYSIDTSPAMIKHDTKRGRGRPTGTRLERAVKREALEADIRVKMTRAQAVMQARVKREANLASRQAIAPSSHTGSDAAKAAALSPQQQAGVEHFLRDGMSVSIAAMEKLTGASQDFLKRVPPVSAILLMEAYEEELHELIKAVAEDAAASRCRAPFVCAWAVLS